MRMNTKLKTNSLVVGSFFLLYHCHQALMGGDAHNGRIRSNDRRNAKGENGQTLSLRNNTQLSTRPDTRRTQRIQLPQLSRFIA